MHAGFRLSLLLAVVTAFTFLSLNPASGQGANPPAATSKSDQLNYENATPNNAIDLLETLSGKHYIRDQNLSVVPPITVKASGGLTKDEEINLITATLLLNGVAILPVDDHNMKVVTVGTNKNPRSEGLKTYSNEADLPADDEIVAYYMALDHISPQEAAGIFAQVAPVHTYGAYVPAPSANAIILVENANVIRELIALKKGIDANNPGPPRPPPPPSPPGPPGHRHPICGLLVLGILIVLASALGNFLAHVWLSRNRAKKAS